MASAQNGAPLPEHKHKHPEDLFQSPYRSRYCRNSPLLFLFSETNKIKIWRSLWLWLAEAQFSLGLPQIKQEMIQEMRENLDNIHWEHARAEEKRLRHDVMAHIHTLEGSAGVIHLGATSAYVQDNADLILIRDALDKSTLPRIATCLKKKSFTITGQTYTRLQDAELLNALSLLGAGVQKVCMDLRMLQCFGEIHEPFEESQVGSSAMPYKRNPMRSERCCGFARFLMNLPGNALNTAAEQGFERTLDDSANRRLVLPEAFLTAEAMLMTFQNILEGLVVREETVRRKVMEELPFLSLEHVLMDLTRAGVSRQEAHEKIRQISLAAHEKRVKGESVNLAAMLEGDPFFDPVRGKMEELAGNPEKLIGRCPEQVEEFLEKELKPVLKPYGDVIMKESSLTV